MLNSAGKLLFLVTVGAGVCAGQDALEIVRRSLAADETNAKIAQDYTYLERVEKCSLDGDGRVKDRVIRTYDVMFIRGSPYRRLVARNDGPLSPKDQVKEREKLEEAVGQRQEETADQHAARVADYQRKLERQRETFRQVLEAFHFSLLGKERQNGREVYVVAATPRPGFTPRTRAARFFPKVKGKLWIDQQSYQWVRAEAEAIDNISVVGFLFRVAKGARLDIELAHVNNEVWLPKRVEARATASLLLLKKFNVALEMTYSNFRKFQADSRIISTAPVPDR